MLLFIRQVLVGISVFCTLLSTCLPLLSQDQLTPPSAKAEPYLYVGGYALYTNTFYSADFQSLPQISCCSPGFTSGVGSGISVGGIIAKPILPNVQVELRVGYSPLSGRLSTVETAGNTRSDLGSSNPNNITTVDIEHEISSVFNALTVEPILTYILFTRVRAQLGYRSAFVLSKSFTSKEEILSPADVIFRTEQSRIRNVQSGVLENFSTLQHSAIFGLGVDFPIKKSLSLTPEIRFVLPFSSLLSNADWKAGALHLGVAMRYSLYPPPPPIIIHDTIYQRDTVEKIIVGKTFIDTVTLLRTTSVNTERNVTENDVVYSYRTTTISESYLRELSKLAALSVALETNALDVNNQKQPVAGFIVEETEFEENYPLLPYVFFPDGSADLSSTRMNLLKVNETTFNENELQRNTLDVYHELLNIVGSRLVSNPTSTLTILGCNSNIGIEKNNRDLSKQRAEVVRNYLIRTWDIEPKRLIVRSQGLPSSPANSSYEDGQAENRRVELMSDNDDILRNVSIKDITVAANPPVIEIVPSVVAEVGLQNWTAVITQDSNVLRTYNGETNTAPILWNVTDKPYPKLEAPIDISYSVVDQSGQKNTKSTQLKVQQLTLKKKRFEQKDDKRIDRYSLIVFDFNKADLGPENKAITQQVRKRIQPASKVQIAGYADKSGDPVYNRELAKRRCVEVQKSIGLQDSNSEIKPIGSDVLLYDNTTPEGRSYSRTVQIIIETPIKIE